MIKPENSKNRRNFPEKPKKLWKTPKNCRHASRPGESPCHEARGYLPPKFSKGGILAIFPWPGLFKCILIARSEQLIIFIIYDAVFTLVTFNQHGRFGSGLFHRITFHRITFHQMLISSNVHFIKFDVVSVYLDKYSLKNYFF